MNSLFLYDKIGIVFGEEVSEMSDVLLQAKGLVKSFGDIRVLQDLSFEVKAGEFVTLLGPSGCGKTTTLHILAGLLELRRRAGDLDRGERVAHVTLDGLRAERGDLFRVEVVIGP